VKQVLQNLVALANLANTMEVPGVPKFQYTPTSGASLSTSPKDLVIDWKQIENYAKAVDMQGIYFILLKVIIFYFFSLLVFICLFIPINSFLIQRVIMRFWNN